MNHQFGTFNETSYEGNPFLCGPAVHKQCNEGNTVSGTPTVAKSSEKSGIDPISFLASFSAAYVISLLAFVIVLYINPYWRRIWFDFIDSCLSFMFPFWSEAIYR
ncbi:hypothetical protein IFM89_033186 [Coptis chinensis]|uniref:Uncharacterized protein n=1 Tax=Coptis chinensis TaxID=261450 RepID=A0A835MAW6_9MAGN|nr:hypothetical protein IFM89_033186 [Coptis chinensis]